MTRQGSTLPVTGPFPLPKGWKRLDAFAYKHKSGLAVILTESIEADENLWRHLSVSAHHRLPTWDELHAAKTVFLGREALALQVLPPESEWVNDHPYCLHLWQCVSKRPVPDFRRGKTI